MGSEAAFAPIYMKYDGIDGDVAARGREGWIEVQSYSWGAAQPGAAALTVSQPPRAQGPGMIVLRKRIDKATPLLARSLTNRQRAPRVTVEVPAPAGQQGYYTYTLEDVVISSVTPAGAAGGAMPMESISFNYSKITWTHVPQPQAQTLRAPAATAPARDPGY
jgi:type VI secretion system secreted protein Hcp